MRDEDLRAFERALEAGDLSELQRIGPHVVRHARGLALPPSEERERIAARLEGWAAFWKAHDDRDPADGMWLHRLEGFAREMRERGGIEAPPDMQGPGINEDMAQYEVRDTTPMPVPVLSPRQMIDLALTPLFGVMGAQLARRFIPALRGGASDGPAEQPATARRKMKGRKKKRRA